MRGTDELPRNDLEGNRICEELTGEALAEYLRAQRRSERERAEKAERERDEAREQVALLVAAMQRTRWGDAPPEVERLKGEVAEMTRDLRKLAGDDNLPASSAAVVAMARIQTLERERDEALKHIAQLEDLYGSAALRLQELGEKEVSLTPLAALFADARAEVERLKAQRDALVVELRESYEYLDGWCQGDSCPGDEHEESFKNGEVHCPVCVLRRSWRKLLSEIEAPQ